MLGTPCSELLFKRDFRRLNATEMLPLMENNVILQQVFHESCQTRACTNMQEGMHEVIEDIAPEKNIQVSKKESLKISTEAQDIKQRHDMALSQAIVTDDFRYVNRLRNQHSKQLDKDEKKEIEKAMENQKSRWKLIQKIQNITKEVPTRITTTAETLTSPRKIAAECLDFTMKKVEKIRRTFSDSMSLALLCFLCLSNKNQAFFKFELATPEQVYEIITNAKATRSTGNDALSMDVIKQTPTYFSLAISQVINRRYLTSTFPENLKTAKIFPILKSRKPPDNLASWRGVSNLQATEKIIEEQVKQQLLKFLNKHKCIPDAHHGHSTLTAKSVIEHSTALHMERHKNPAIMCTDLSMEFDIIDP